MVTYWVISPTYELEYWGYKLFYTSGNEQLVHLKITQLTSAKSFNPNLHDVGFKMLIIQGVTLKVVVNEFEDQLV